MTVTLLNRAKANYDFFSIYILEHPVPISDVILIFGRIYIYKDNLKSDT